MKSTPTRGVKQYLKPNAYNQLEPSLQINQETDMYYVYVLRSERGGHYIGYSADLKRRLAEHNEGKNASTRGRSWDLLYYEAYRTERLARDRERVLKGHGRSKQALLARLSD